MGRKGPLYLFPALESLIFGISRSSEGNRGGKGRGSFDVCCQLRERKFFFPFSGTASFLRCCNFVGCLPAQEWCGGQRTKRTVRRLLLAPPLPPPSLLSLYYRRRLLLLLSLSQEKKKGGGLFSSLFRQQTRRFFFREIAGRKRGNECVCVRRKGEEGGDPAAVSGAKVLQARPITPIHLPSYPSLLPTFGGGKGEV